ncbi:unnamed protein product [Ectocarpus fasciculatus]
MSSSSKHLWIRYENDDGDWEPAFLLPKCPPEVVMDVRGGVASVSESVQTGCGLYWVRRSRTLVEATRISEHKPPSEGLGEPSLKGCKREKDIHAGRTSLSDTTVPSTPSTLCASTCSTVTPSTSSGIPSSVWSQFSGGNTPRECPSSSASSTLTQLDATQQEPSADRQVDANVPNASNGSGSDLDETPCGSDYGEGYEASTQVGEESCSTTHGVKRPREQTPRVDQSKHAQEGSRFSDSSDGQTPDEMPSRALPGDLGSPRRKKECLAQSQYPRLDGHPTPAGPRSHRNQFGNSGAQEESMPRLRSNAADIFDGAMGSSEASCEGRHPLNKQRVGGATAANQTADEASEQASMDNPPEQKSIDVRRAAGDPGSDKISLEGIEGEPTTSSSGDSHNTTSSRAGQFSSRKESGGQGPINQARCSDPRDGDAVEDVRMKDAASFRSVGITEDSQRKDIFDMLKQLGWTWSAGTLHKLSNEFWMLKPGSFVRKGKAGVDKFAGQEQTIEYVKSALRLSAAAMSDGQGQLSEETTKREEEEKEEEGEGDTEREEEGQEKGEREDMTNEPEQHRLKTSTTKGRALQSALEALNPSNAPGALKQRTTEFNQVLQFVTNSVAKASGGSLYLCGVPGTGKTQTMAHVRAEVQEKFSKGHIPAPAFHAFTGTEFTSPNAMHGALWRAINGARGGEEGIGTEKKLDNKLKYWQKKPTGTSPMLVVVLDEIDQLMTENRQVLRKLFQWADAPKSRLVLVGLANSLDFNISFSGLKKAPQRLLFQSYTPEDLASILTERVGSTVHPSAIQFCAKKAAATTGDARRAINTCREAVVLADQELQQKLDNASSEAERVQLEEGGGDNLVTIRHMAKAVAAGNAAKYAGAIAALSLHAKVVLTVAAAAVGAVSDRGEGAGAHAGKGMRLTQGILQEKCSSAWRILQTAGGPSQIEFTGIIDLLAASGLLGLKSKQQTGGRTRELVLKIEFADLEAALGDQSFFKTVTGVQ